LKKPLAHKNKKFQVRTQKTFFLFDSLTVW
jgi:hypothetical protein